MKLLVFLVFQAASVVFAQSRVPAPAESVTANLPVQKIGPNDLISVSVYNSPELTRTARVSVDGMIRLPMVQQRIRVEGLMPGDVEAVIAAVLKREQLIVDPFVTVTVAEYHSRPISVMGAVKSPTTFQAVTDVTLLDALTRAEGLTADAGPEILVSRNQPGPDGAPVSLVQRISVKALIDGADPDSNLKLVGGEEIRVPTAGKIYIVGNVKKPGAYPVEDLGGTSVLKALSQAEGLTEFAGKQAFVYRREGMGQKNEIPIELRRILDRKAPDAPLMANDVLYVPDASTRRFSVAALEKALLLGSGITTALIYAGTR